MINLDEAIAARLRRKHDTQERRAEEARPKSEFSPRINQIDRSMSPSVSSQPRQPPANDFRSNQSKRPLDSADSNRSVPKSPGEAIMRAVSGRKFDELENSKSRPPYPEERRSRPPYPVADPDSNMPRLKQPDVRPMPNLNLPPPPLISPNKSTTQSMNKNRRGSNTSIGSRLSRRFKFWDRRQSDEDTADNAFARVKNPVGA